MCERHPNHVVSGQSGRPRRPWPFPVKLVLLVLAWSAVLVLLSGCQAPMRLQVHGLSKHGQERHRWHADRAWNEVNPGLGVQVGGRFFATAGAFENSYAELSPYAGLGCAAYKTEDLELGLLGGVADYGYAKAIGFLYARAGWVQVGYAPDLGQYGGDLWTLGLSVPLN